MIDNRMVITSVINVKPVPGGNPLGITRDAPSNRATETSSLVAQRSLPPTI